MDGRAFASPKGLRPRRRVKPGHDVRIGENVRRCLSGTVLGQSAGAHATRLTPRNDMVLTGRDGSPSLGIKRECGAGKPHAAAAPATVSGESFVTGHWESRSREGGERYRPA